MRWLLALPFIFFTPVGMGETLFGEPLSYSTAMWFYGGERVELVVEIPEPLPDEVE